MMHPIYLGGLGPAAVVVTVAAPAAGPRVVRARGGRVPARLQRRGCGGTLANGFASFERAGHRDRARTSDGSRGYFTEMLPRDLGLMDRGGGWRPRRPRW